MSKATNTNVNTNKGEVKMVESKNELVVVDDIIIINLGTCDDTINLEGEKAKVISVEHKSIRVKGMNTGLVATFLQDGRTGVIYTKFNRAMRAAEIKDELVKHEADYKKFIAGKKAEIDMLENYKSDAEYYAAKKKEALTESVKEVMADLKA